MSAPAPAKAPSPVSKSKPSDVPRLTRSAASFLSSAEDGESVFPGETGVSPGAAVEGCELAAGGGAESPAPTRAMPPATTRHRTPSAAVTLIPDGVNGPCTLSGGSLSAPLVPAARSSATASTNTPRADGSDQPPIQPAPRSSRSRCRDEGEHEPPEPARCDTDFTLWHGQLLAQELSRSPPPRGYSQCVLSTCLRSGAHADD